MGDTYFHVLVQGVDGEGSPAHVGPASADALVDTGASRTIVSRAVAADAGIRVAHREVVYTASGQKPIDVGFAMIRGVDCAARLVVAGISDEITKRAGSPMILGHDYMQRADMRVRPAKQKAWCEPKKAAGGRR